MNLNKWKLLLRQGIGVVMLTVWQSLPVVTNAVTMVSGCVLAVVLSDTLTDVTHWQVAGHFATSGKIYQ